MGQAISGIQGVVKAGTTDMQVEGWSADWESVEIDTTTTADGGYEDAIDGAIKVSGSFDFFWFPARDPFNSVINLLPGAALLGGSYPTLTLALDSAGNNIGGTAKILKLSVKSAVKDAVKITCSFRSKGVWTKPTV